MVVITLYGGAVSIEVEGSSNPAVSGAHRSLSFALCGLAAFSALALGMAHAPLTMPPFLRFALFVAFRDAALASIVGGVVLLALVRHHGVVRRTAALAVTVSALALMAGLLASAFPSGPVDFGLGDHHTYQDHQPK
jgi:hypothetical protein